MREPRADRPHMPGYGVAGPEAGLLPWSWAEERLSSAARYWIASVSPDGAPHATPVWAIWLDGHIWFSTGGRSRKARNLREESRCVVHTDGEDPVALEGIAEFVTDTAAVDRMVARYTAKYPAPPPDPAANPIIRVRPLRVFGLVESEFSTSPTRGTF
jgi:PPOX class probable F420-dependent enzyme